MKDEKTRKNEELQSEELTQVNGGLGTGAADGDDASQAGINGENKQEIRFPMAP